MRIIAAIALVAVTLGGARPAEAAGEVTVTTTLLGGSPLAPLTEVRRNQPVTVRVSVANTTAQPLTVTGITLATTTGLEGTALATIPATIAPNTTVDVNFTELDGTMTTGIPNVSVTATVTGTFPDDTVTPVDAGTDPDPVSVTSAAATAPLRDFAVRTQLLRGGAPALALIAGEAVTVRVTVLSDLPTVLTVPIGGVVITRTNMTGSASNTTSHSIPPGPVAFNIDIPGYVAGPGTPATASAVVNGTVPDNTLKPNDAQPDPDPVTANNTASPVSVPVGSFTVATSLANPATPGTPASSFFAGAPVTVRVTITTNLPAPLTIGPGGVVLTTANLSGTAAPNVLTLISAGPQTTTIDITGLTAGPGTPATASAVVNGLLPDGTLNPVDGSADAVSANNTATPASAAVVTPTFTFTGNPAPGAGDVARGDTVVVTATVTNPAGAPTIIAGTFIITAPDKTTITAAPVGSTTASNAVTMIFPTIAPGTSASVEVTTQLNLDAAKVDGAANDFTYTATFASVSLAAPLSVANLSYEISPNADVQMLVNAPDSEARDPSQADVPVQYQVRNTGPDTAAGISFVATGPTGAIGSPNVSEGADWTCNTAGGNVTCTYDPGTLVKDALTATVVITWRFNAIGLKTFSATASSTTFDPTLGNNTASDTTDVVNPSSTVSVISAAATPDPVTVAVDRDASVAVAYVIKNTGNKNLTVRATVSAPAGATLLTLTGTGGATCTAVTAVTPSCDVQVNKNGGEVTINATYTVPQASFTSNQANFTVTITALDGGTIDPGPLGNPTITTLSDFVVGQPPVIDIGLAPIAGNAVVTVPYNKIPPGDVLTVNRTITFQNFSTDLSVRAGTLSIEIELPAGPVDPITIQSATIGAATVTCTEVAASSPKRLRCAVPGVVAPATTVDLVLVLVIRTVDPFTITARPIVDDAANRSIDANPATPDTRQFAIDLNREPRLNNEVGPAIPVGGIMRFTPVGINLLHQDNDNDPLELQTAEAPTCDAGATKCILSGGTATGLTYAISNNVLTVTFAGNGTVAPTVPGNDVTATITYRVSDGKVAPESTLKVKLLPAVTYEGARAVPGSFGTPQTPAPRSFGEEVTADRMGITPSVLEVLEGALGLNANGVEFPAANPDFRTYDVSLADTVPLPGTSLNVTPTGPAANPETGVSKVPSELLPAASPVRQAIRYVPARGYTSDAPITPDVNLVTAPADSFVYQTQGKFSNGSIYTVDIPARVHVKNQSPIGIDSPFDVPNNVTQKVFPANNDLDGNTLATKIKTKVPNQEFVFDDEGDLTDPPGDRRLKIKCIGPPPATEAELADLLSPNAAFSKCPVQDVSPPAPGWKRTGEPLVLETPDSKGKVTVTLEGGTGADAFRGVTLSADATVVGELDFVYVVVDNYGGGGLGKATVRVPNTPPQVIEGVRTVLKNTPTVVVDTRLAAQDANGDTIEVSGTSERTQHGTSKIGDLQRTITYTPDRDYLGPDKLLYQVSDGRADGAASAELQLNVIEQPGAITDAGGAGSGAGAGGGASPGGNLAATGGDPLALTLAAGCALVLGLALVQAGKRRQSLPLLDRARHLRT